MALLFLIRTPFYTAFAYQESPEFHVLVAFDFKAHILFAHFQVGYFGQLDSVLSHSCKCNASLPPLLILSPDAGILDSI